MADDKQVAGERAMQGYEAQAAGENQYWDSLYKTDPQEMKRSNPVEYARRKANDFLTNAIVEPTVGGMSPELREKAEPKVRQLVQTGLSAYGVPGKTEQPAVNQGVAIPMGLDPEEIRAVGGRTIAEPTGRYVYRAMDADSPTISGAPYDQATSSLDEARSWYKSRGEKSGKPQRLVRVDLNKLDPKAYDISGGIGTPDLVRFKAPVKEFEDISHFEGEPHQAAARAQYKTEGDKLGIEFRGTMPGVDKHPGLAIYQDPESGTSIAVKLDQFSPEKLGEHLEAARKRMKGSPNKPGAKKEDDKPVSERAAKITGSEQKLAENQPWQSQQLEGEIQRLTTAMKNPRMSENARKVAVQQLQSYRDMIDEGINAATARAEAEEQ